MQSNAVYHVVVYDGQQAGDLYRLSVFEYPALKSSQATLDYPEFTGRDDKVINNTRRLTAVEGTGLTFDFQFNKPLTSALLKARDGEGEDIPAAASSLMAARGSSYCATSASRASSVTSCTLRMPMERTVNRIPVPVCFQRARERRPGAEV